jgi:sec-independent protein translocase protein TatB
MEFLGIGTWELMVIGLIALVVLGPKQMIILARRAGELLRQFQAIWQEASKTIDKEIKAIESEAGDLTQLPKEITALTTEMKNALNLDLAGNGKPQPTPPPAPSIKPPHAPTTQTAWQASPTPPPATPGNGTETVSPTSQPANANDQTTETPKHPTAATPSIPTSQPPSNPPTPKYSAWKSKSN